MPRSASKNTPRLRADAVGVTSWPPVTTASDGSCESRRCTEPRQLCFVDVQLESVGPHPDSDISNASCETRGELADVARPHAGAVDLRIVSIEVRRQFMLFDQHRKIDRIQARTTTAQELSPEGRRRSAKCVWAEQLEPRRTHSLRPLRYDASQRSALPVMPDVRCLRFNRISWSTVLNAVNRSRRTSAAKSPPSTVARVSDKTCKMAVSVELPGRKPDCSVGSNCVDVDSSTAGELPRARTVLI
jgi:hypothetical protein